MTTPLLPSFISSCLNLVSLRDSQTSKASVKSVKLLPVVLESFNLLLPYHPATFRPFSARIHELLLSFLTDSTVSIEVKSQGRELFTTLHYCAAKNAATSEWENACQSLLASVHATADQVFRAVLEDWESSDEQRRQTTIKHNYDEDVASLGDDPLRLPVWEGIHDGAMHVSELLCLLTTFLRASTTASISIPVGSILDLTARLSSVLLPTSGRDSVGLRPNPEVGKEEREEMFLYIPPIHLATLDLFSSMVDAVEGAGLPVYLTIIDQASWIFNAEHEYMNIRYATFRLIRQLLPHVGSSATKADMRTLNPILRACAGDLSPGEEDRPPENGATTKTKQNNSVTINADSFLKAAKTPNLKSQERGLPSAAWQLLPSIFQYLPSNLLSQTLHGELDRAAILTAHKEALLASTLNPPPVVRGKPAPASLLPWLSRVSGDDLAFEGFLRPRMPVVQTATVTQEGESDNEETDMDKAFASMGPWKTAPEPQTSTMGPSLLDQLEDQLPEDTPTRSLGADEAIKPAAASQPQPAISQQKRDFAQVEPITSSAPTFPTNGSPIDAKRLKTENKQNPETSSTLTHPNSKLQREAETGHATLQNANIITEHVAPISSVTVPPEANEQGVAMDTTAPAQGIITRNDKDEGGDHDDESDFEIPEINVDPDTNDELEEDDDDDDENSMDQDMEE